MVKGIWSKSIICVVVMLTFCCGVSRCQESEQSFNVSAQSFGKMPLLVILQGLHGAELEEVTGVVVRDLGFTGQFAPVFQARDMLPDRGMFKEFTKKGYLLVLFISSCDNAAGIEWRLYDAGMGAMLKGKRYYKHGSVPRGWGHDIANSVWPVLTGEPGFFSARIAFCKQVKGKKRPLQHIYLADYDGSHEEPLVTTPTVNTMPRWSSSEPTLFYSEHGCTNVSMMRVRLNKVKSKAASFQGITMQPAFSADGKTVVFCASKGTGDCQLYRFDGGNEMKQITHNKGVNFSPSLSGNGQQVFFCSDFEGAPNIYSYDVVSQQMLKITADGYCMSPSYNERRNWLAYTKKVQGTHQVFIYDAKTGVHRQLTNSAGHKEECSWSPCGNYLVFSVSQGNSSRIALLHVLTHEQRFITAANVTCSYPAWSPVYGTFPVVT